MTISGRIDTSPAQIRTALLRLPLTRRGLLGLFVVAVVSPLLAARVSTPTIVIVTSAFGLTLIGLFVWSIDFTARTTFEGQGTPEVTHVVRQEGAHTITVNGSDFTPWTAFRAFFHTPEFLFLERDRDDYEVIFLSAFAPADREKVIELVGKHVWRTDGAMFKPAARVAIVLYVVSVVALGWVMLG